MYKALLCVWVSCISLGFVFRLCGDPAIIMFLLLLMLVKDKVKIHIPLMLSLTGVMFFFIFKLSGIEGYIPISDYHSSITLIKNNILVFVLLFEMSIWKNNQSENKFILVWFNRFYYISIIISSIILILGENYYRNGTQDVPILLAPQFYLIYAVVLSILLVYDLIMNPKHRRKNILFLLLNGIYIIVAGYTTQMIFWLIGMGLAYLFARFPKGRKRLIATIVLFSLVLVAIPLLPSIVRLVNGTFFANNYEVNKRLSEIEKIFLNESIQGGALSIRMDLIKKSLYTFKENPMWGVSYSKYNSVEGTFNVGGHCEWADSLARYGILGLGIWALCLCLGFKYIRQNREEKSDIDKVVVLLLMMYGFFNPIIKPYLVIIWFVVVTFITDQYSNENARYKW